MPIAQSSPRKSRTGTSASKFVMTESEGPRRQERASWGSPTESLHSTEASVWRARPTVGRWSRPIFPYSTASRPEGTMGRLATARQRYRPDLRPRLVRRLPEPPRPLHRQGAGDSQAPQGGAVPRREQRQPGAVVAARPPDRRAPPPPRPLVLVRLVAPERQPRLP